MITGRKTALQYTTKRGHGADRRTILAYVPDPEKRRRHVGSLSVTRTGYKYEPSSAYKRALNKYHTVPKRRVSVTNFSI